MPTNQKPESGLQAQELESASLPTDVDLDELAKKVFELILRELEIENDRTGKD